MSASSRVAWIAELADFAGTSTRPYTALKANIRPLTAEKLAELALCSAAAPAGAERRDGISYLQQQKRRGILTSLMPATKEQCLYARAPAISMTHGTEFAPERVRSGAR
jgi:hypothetical protein